MRLRNAFSAIAVTVAATLLATVGTGCVIQAPATSDTGETSAASVVINGREADPEQLARLEQSLGTKIPAGQYWHDPRSGLAGPRGSYARAFAPGFDFGPVPVDASGGNTRVYYNGRELNLDEARVVAFLYDIPEAMIPQFRGRYVLESSGDLFRESDGAYLGNLLALAQQKSRTSSGSGFNCSGSSMNGPTCSGSSGGCTAVTIPSSSPSPTGVPNRIDVATGSGC